MTKTISLLHISDLHLTNIGGKRALQQNIFRKFFEYIENWNQKESEQNPYLILITGDLVRTGKPDEYGLKSEKHGTSKSTAYYFLDKICNTFSLEHNRICIVPGNHDVDRDLINDWAAPSQLKVIENHNRLADFFFSESDQGHRTEIFRRFRPYCEFYSQFKDVLIPNHPDSIIDFLYEPRIFNKNNELPTNIYIAELCSSWLCHSYYWAFKKDSSFITTNYSEPEHNIALCLPKIEESIFESFKSNGEGFIISLIHHPLNWIVNWEIEPINNVLGKSSDLILTGHIHRNAIYIPALSHKGHRISAGAFYQDANYRNSFNIIKIEFEEEIPMWGYLKTVEWHATKNEWQDANVDVEFTSAQSRIGYATQGKWLRFPLSDTNPQIKVSTENVYIGINRTTIDDAFISAVENFIIGITKDVDCSFHTFNPKMKELTYSVKSHLVYRIKEILIEQNKYNNDMFINLGFNYIKINNQSFNLKNLTKIFSKEFIDNRSPLLHETSIYKFHKSIGEFWKMCNNALIEFFKVREVGDILEADIQNNENEDIKADYEYLNMEVKEKWDWYSKKRLNDSNQIFNSEAEDLLLNYLEEHVIHGTKKVILIYGGTGNGKTTFIRYFFKKYLPLKNPSFKNKLIAIRISLGIAGLTFDSLEDDVDNKINTFLNDKYPELYNDEYLLEMAKMSQNLNSDFFKRLLKEINMGSSRESKIQWISSIIGRRSIQKKCNNPFADFNRIRITYLSKTRGFKFLLVLDNIDQMPRDIQEVAFMLARHKLEWVKDTNDVTIILALRTYMLARAAKELPIAAYQNRYEIRIYPPYIKDVLTKRYSYVYEQLPESYQYEDNEVFKGSGVKINISKNRLVLIIKKWINSVSNVKTSLCLHKLSNGDMREQLKMVKAIFESPNYDWIKLIDTIEKAPPRQISENKIIDILTRGKNALCAVESPRFFINIFNIDGQQHYANTLNKIYILKILKILNSVDLDILINYLSGLGHPVSWTKNSIDQFLKRNIVVSPEGQYLYKDKIKNIYFDFDGDTIAQVYTDSLVYQLYYLQAMAYITPMLPEYKNKIALPTKFDHDIETFYDRVIAASYLLKQISYDEQKQKEFILNNSYANNTMNQFDLNNISSNISNEAMKQLHLIQDAGNYPKLNWENIFSRFEMNDII